VIAIVIVGGDASVAAIHPAGVVASLPQHILVLTAIAVLTDLKL
jgi:hypothetical protein